MANYSVRVFALAFIMLALCLSGLQSAGFVTYPYAKFVQANMSYRVVDFSYENNSYQALLVGNEPCAVLTSNSEQYLFEPLDDAADLNRALYGYYLSAGYSPDALQLLSSVHDGVAILRDAKIKSEYKCRVFMGTDRFPCNDFDSCIKACYAAPECPIMAFGFGKPLVYAMWEYENETTALDQAYSRENETFQSLLSNASYEDVVAYVDSLSAINRAATKVSSSEIFSYIGGSCPSPVYSLASLTSLQLSAQRSLANYSKFYFLENKTSDALYCTKSGLLRKANVERLEEEAEANATKAKAEKLKANSTNASQSQNLSANQSMANVSKPDSPGTPIAPPQNNLPYGLIAIVAVAAVGAIAAAVYFMAHNKRNKKHRHG